MREAWFGAMVALTGLLAGCGAPAVQAPPAAVPTLAAVAPTVAPSPTAIAATPTTGATAAPPTAAPAPRPTEVPAAGTPDVTPPPPTPDAPLDAALRSFAGNALLYTRLDRFLMLTDVNGQQIWLTADQHFCGRSNTALSQGGVWSADGRYLAIECQYDGLEPNVLVETITVNVLDTTTGKLRQIVASQNWAGMSAQPWSPAGARLLVYADEAVGPAWSVFDLTSSKLTRLIAIDPDTGSSGAAWSPDGSQVAVIGQRVGEQHQGVYLMNADGTHVRQLPLDAAPAFSGLSPAIGWSPDGRSMLVGRQLNPAENTYSYQALRLDLQSGDIAVLAENLLDWPDMRWSPDGRGLLLKKYATDDRTIVAWSLYQADGTLARTFSSEPTRSIEQLAWMPDGRLALAVNRVNFGVELLIAELEGKEQVIATRPGAFAHTIAVAPDGSLFAIEMAAHIVIFDGQGKALSEFDGTIQGWRPKR
jgi:WD40 repeat protein